MTAPVLCSAAPLRPFPPNRARAVNGKWVEPKETEVIPDPMNGEGFILAPNPTSDEDLQPFVDSLRSVPKTGLHNPWKNTGRYRMMGDVSAKAARLLRDKDVRDYFIRLMTRVVPKAHGQTAGEVDVTATFLENFSGDNVRFMAQSFGVSGDHEGQESRGYRVPFGPVALITPFNFSIEISALQGMGALYMGNKPLIKVDSRVSVVHEQFTRMLIEECGLPATDCDLIHCGGPAMERILLAAKPATTLFTGSSTVAERLAEKLHGRVKLEDAGFDWKILGPDPPSNPRDIQYVAWQCDQDAYGATGQKCSAQSILFVHKNWSRKTDILDQLKSLAGRRSLADLTVGPVLSWTTERMLAHADKLAALPGAKLLWGGKELTGHTIPPVYGAIEPTAVSVPIKTAADPKFFDDVTSEVFGPFQVVCEYDDDEVEMVEDCLERLSHHLTAAVVTSDPTFRNRILGATVNGTTYAGLRARTTGAPVNHWFGPAGDPRGAGIGTPEAIKLVWSCHREVVADEGPVPEGWSLPPPS